MSKAKLQNLVEKAISVADSSYFFEDYTKQAAAVLKAIEAAGYAIIPKDLPDTVWETVANEMKTGRVKPEEHVKDVYQVTVRNAAIK